MGKKSPGYKATIIQRRVFGGQDYRIKDSIGREWFPWMGRDPYSGTIPVGYACSDGTYRAGIFTPVEGTDSGFIKIYKEGSQVGDVVVKNSVWKLAQEDEQNG